MLRHSMYELAAACSLRSWCLWVPSSQKCHARISYSVCLWTSCGCRHAYCQRWSAHWSAFASRLVRCCPMRAESIAPSLSASASAHARSPIVSQSSTICCGARAPAPCESVLQEGDSNELGFLRDDALGEPRSRRGCARGARCRARLAFGTARPRRWRRNVQSATKGLASVSQVLCVAIPGITGRATVLNQRSEHCSVVMHSCTIALYHPRTCLVEDRERRRAISGSHADKLPQMGYAMPGEQYFTVPVHSRMEPIHMIMAIALLRAPGHVHIPEENVDYEDSDGGSDSDGECEDHRQLSFAYGQRSEEIRSLIHFCVPHFQVLYEMATFGQNCAGIRLGDVSHWTHRHTTSSAEELIVKSVTEHTADLTSGWNHPLFSASKLRSFRDRKGVILLVVNRALPATNVYCEAAVCVDGQLGGCLWSSVVPLTWAHSFAASTCPPQFRPTVLVGSCKVKYIPSRLIPFVPNA